MYDFEMFAQSKYRTRIQIFTYFDCDQSKETSYSYLESLICWANYFVFNDFRS